MRASAKQLSPATEFESYLAKQESAPGQSRQARDDLIYQWVMFDGKSQTEVGSMLGLSQGTVSRALRRYERRQAHLGPREGGRLDPQEQLRVQRWLTYERNERILRSCLRIATEVEGFVDVSKSTVHKDGLAGAGNEIRTVHATLDRSGTAARFLRLAFRINMEQLELVEMEPLTPLPPLSADELAEMEREEDSNDLHDPPQENEPAVKLAELDGDEQPAAPDREGEVPAEPKAEVGGANGREGEDREDEAPAESAEQASVEYAHSAHQRIAGEEGATADRRSSCDATDDREKNSDERRIGAGDLREKRPARRVRVVYGGMPLDDDALSTA